MANYLNILLLAGFAAVFSGAFLLLSRFMGPHRPTDEKLAPYECGLPVEGSFIGKFPIKFYLVVILFLLFDLEVVFLYPWAIQAKQGSVSAMLWFVEGLLFAIILLVGWFYVVKRGVLDWGTKVAGKSQQKK